MHDPGRPDKTLRSIDTTPGYAEPEAASIEAAARDLPVVLGDLGNTPHLANDPPVNGIHRAVLASVLLATLETKKNHSKAAAAHAIHRLVQNGMLEAELALPINLKTVHHVGTWPPGTVLARSAFPGGPEGHIRIGAIVETTEAVPPASGTPAWDGTGPVPYDRLLIRSVTVHGPSN